MYRVRYWLLVGPLLWMGMWPQEVSSDPLAGLTYNRPVLDQAQIIPEPYEDAISRLLLGVRQQGGTHIGVVTIPSLEGGTIEDVSIRIAEAWQLGEADQDNGVIIVVSRDDRRMRIEVGQGREGDLPDAYAKRIIDQQMTPLFKQQRFGEGVLAGVIGVLARTDPGINAQSLIGGAGRGKQTRLQSEDAPLWSKVLRLIIMGLVLLFLLFTPFGRLMLFSMLLGGRGGSGRGGGFGGGGFGGGGGGFSGGGASGGW